MSEKNNVFVTTIIIFICSVGFIALFMICYDYYHFKNRHKNELERQNQLLLQEQQENLYL